MHMVGPWLTTTGKKKGKKKWASAEQKRRADRAAEYQKQIYKEYNIVPKKRTRKGFSETEYKPDYSHPRYDNESINKIPSLNINSGGNAGRNEPRVYSGERTLLGIATMHKSNMVPVFSTEEATEISRMRRG